MIRARLIYNPTSGREEVRRRLPAILQKLERGGIETSCHATEREGDAVQAASEAVERGFDLVIAAGGDGTLNEVVNGIARHDRRPALGILPLGTTNDFARAHGIPKRWDQACDLIVKRYTRPVDIGRADGKYFINIAGGGSLTQLSYEVPSKLKTMIGHLAYYIRGFEKIVSLRSFNMRIVAEGVGEFNDEYMLFLVANSNSVAGFEKLAPNASTGDGLFDVLLMRKCNLAEFIRIATLAMRGEHVNDSHITLFQTSKLEVLTDDGVQLNLDGEYGGDMAGSFSILQGHINIIVDEFGESSYHR
ncbi:diacylglycerol kinase [Cohnella nanjingensis]|uniref:Diacylglycerol kinase n=1 Tax=Cohnella nanjingensis TaxID=1387779 RepID=A0A7X0VEC5_9BACL|nr:diacylglycerol kinase [Cohnella nanjingensis]MBB6670133.1 diacylglycerol kinase [Cohnella nanjingensis]